MTEKERKKYLAYMALREELEEEKRHGYSLSFAGEEASAAQIAKICIFQEGSSYMRDYVPNPSGNLPILDFNEVK